MAPDNETSPPGTSGMATGKLWKKRKDQRNQVSHAAVLHYNGTQIPVVLKDISYGGSQVSLYPNRAAMEFDGPLTLEVPGKMKLPIELRWRKATKLGAAFVAPAHQKMFLQKQIDRISGKRAR